MKSRKQKSDYDFRILKLVDRRVYKRCSEWVGGNILDLDWPFPNIQPALDLQRVRYKAANMRL